MTTYNNVQDAINNVQTNESSVTMSIPPYSKWELPIEETNLREAFFPKEMIWDTGNHRRTNFTAEETIEFIIPFTYDYSLANWSTVRNRLYIDNVRVEQRFEYVSPSYSKLLVMQKNGDKYGQEFYRVGVNNNDSSVSDYYATQNYNKKINEKKEYRDNWKEFGGQMLGIVGCTAVALLTLFLLL